MTAVRVSGVSSLTLDTSSGKEVWSGENGWTMTGDPQTHLTSGPAQQKWVPLRITPALLIEAGSLPKTRPPWMAAQKPSAWSKDGKPDTTQTAGARRHFVDPALAMWLLTQDNRWRWADIQWCLEQFRRPFAHVPFAVSGDQWSKPWVNRGTPAAWNHNQVLPASGYNAFDYAHMDTARMFGLAATGHPLGVKCLAELWRWAVQSAEPGVCTNWMTQLRSRGWIYELGRAAFLCDLGETDRTKDFREQHCGGWSPKAALKAWLAQDLAQGDALEKANQWFNNRVWPAVNGVPVPCQQTFHVGIYCWGLGRLARSGILSAQESDRAMDRMIEQFDRVLAFAYAPGRGLSWAVLMEPVATQQEAEDLRAALQAQGVSGLETAPIQDGWLVRSTPSWGSELPNMLAAAGSSVPPKPFIAEFQTRPEYGKFPQFDLATEALTGG